MASERTTDKFHPLSPPWPEVMSVFTVMTEQIFEPGGETAECKRHRHTYGCMRAARIYTRLGRRRSWPRTRSSRRWPPCGCLSAARRSEGLQDRRQALGGISKQEERGWGFLFVLTLGGGGGNGAPCLSLPHIVKGDGAQRGLAAEGDGCALLLGTLHPALGPRRGNCSESVGVRRVCVQ